MISVGIVQQRWMRSTLEIDAAFQEVIGRGGEGLVVRFRDQIYQPGVRVATFMKRKASDEDEAIVIRTDVTDKAKRFTVVCRWKDPERFGTSAEFRVPAASWDVNRRDALVPGSVVEIGYKGLLTTGKPKSPCLIALIGQTDIAPASAAAAATTTPKSTTKTTTKRPNHQQQDDHQPYNKTPKTPKEGGRRGVEPPTLTLTTGEWQAKGGYDLAVEEMVGVKGSGLYIVKHCSDGAYSCTCPAWRFQKMPSVMRRCKHTYAVLGHE